MKTGAAILGTLAFFAFYAAFESSGGWGALLLGVVAFLLAGALYHSAEEQEQTIRDRDASQREEEALAGKDPYFYLYLRPFSITNKADLRSAPGLPQDMLKAKPTQTFEAILEGTLKVWGIPLIALGIPGEAIGAGRILSSDKDWERRFQSLAQVATAFIVVPADNAGTYAEIEWLVQHKMLDRTVFAFPQFNDAQTSKELAKKYLVLGLELPDDGDPCIVKLSEKGEVIARVRIESIQTYDGGRIIQWMLHLKSQRSVPDNTVQPSSN